MRVTGTDTEHMLGTLGAVCACVSGAHAWHMLGTHARHTLLAHSLHTPATLRAHTRAPIASTLGQTLGPRNSFRVH